MTESQAPTAPTAPIAPIAPIAPTAPAKLVRRLAQPAALLLSASAIVAAAWCVGVRAPRAPTPVARLTIAVPMQINSAPLLVACAQALFQQAGVEVLSQPFLLGKDALKSLLDGQADLALVADTPFLFALHGGADIAVLASLSQARRVVGEAVKVASGVLAKAFNPEDFVVSLDQAMLLALDDQTRWAMKRGLVKPGPVPNYLLAIKFQPLESVRPSAVKVTH